MTNITPSLLIDNMTNAYVWRLPVFIFNSAAIICNDSYSAQVPKAVYFLLFYGLVVQ